MAGRLVGVRSTLTLGCEVGSPVEGDWEALAPELSGDPCTTQHT